MKLTKEQAKEILAKIKNGTATEEEIAQAKEAFSVISKNIFKLKENITPVAPKPPKEPEE